jgi:ketosteroid isomerase-like protein
LSSILAVDNKDLVRQFRQAADALDFAAAARMMSDDIRWWVPRSAAQIFERPIEGPEAVLRLMSSATNRFYQPETMKRDYHTFVAEGDYVAVWMTMSAETVSGADYTNDYHFLYRCQGGGIAEVWEHLDTAYAMSKFQA